MSRAVLVALLLLAAAGCAADAEPAPTSPPEQAQVADADRPDADGAGTGERGADGPDAERRDDPGTGQRPTATEATATPRPSTPPTPGPAGAASSEPACTDPACYADPVRVGQFDAAELPEASGLAVSRRDPEVLYLVADGSETSAVWAVRRDGEMLGAIEIAGLDARDTESLAVGPCGGEGAGWCLYIGDIGDNGRSREDIRVLRVEEPDLAGGVPARPVPAESIRLRYPDGAHDAEALLVGPDGALVIVTKAPFDREAQVTGTTHVYQAAAFADGTLAHLGELALPEPAQSFHAQLAGNVVTGGDAVDGHVVLRTYDQVLSLRGDDLAALPSWELRTVPSPFELQSEAIALDADGCSVLTAGERVGDIWRVACRG